MARITRRGLALLLVVGVLGILGVLATAFVMMARLERRASLQRLSGTKALLLARSGIEDALARICSGQDPNAPEDRYGGEDWDKDGVLGATPEEGGSEVYRIGQLDTWVCPAEHATRASFPRKVGGNPRTVPVNGRLRGHTGVLARDQVLDGNHYALKLTGDGIHVNGGDLSGAGEHPGTYDTTLKRMLGNLAVQLGVARVVGEGFVTIRPAGGWTSKEQIRQATPPAFLPDVEKMLPYVVLEAWVDRKVIAPNVTWGATLPSETGTAGGQTLAAWAEWKAGKRDTPVLSPTTDPVPHAGPGLPGTVGALWSGKRAFNTRTNSYAPDFERNLAGAVVGRAPVNLNWAQDKPEVLKALLRDLAGIYPDSTSDPGVSFGRTRAPPTGSGDEGNLGIFHLAKLTDAEADSVAAAIQAHAALPFLSWVTEYPDWDRTASFDSWDEFSRFVDLEVTGLTGAPEHIQAQKDLIKANFDPNSMLNKFNPGETMFRLLDKSDLTTYSTEFCFRTPSWTLSSVGRILDPKGRLLATKTLSCSARMEQFRMTTQSEFCAGSLGRLDLAEDESAYRLPGNADFIEPAGGTDSVWGSRFVGGGGGGGAKGFCLQSYPEPQWPLASGNCPSPARYDGRLELASTEASVTSLTSASFLASFDRGYDADFAVGSPTAITDTEMGASSGSLYGNAPTGAGNAVLNMVYPDGCYSESRRQPGYEARDNIGNGIRGLLGFWYRPAHGPYYGPIQSWQMRGHTPFDLTFSVSPMASTAFSGAFLFVYSQRDSALGGLQWWSKEGMIYETPATGFQFWTGGTGIYLGENNGTPQPKAVWHGHRWHYVTTKWFSDWAPTVSAYNNQAVAVNGLYAVPQFAWPLPNPASPPPSYERDGYRPDGSFGSPYFFLGSNHAGAPVGSSSSSADGTLDDVLFLPSTAGTPLAPDWSEVTTFGLPQYRTGRHYKGDEALDPTRSEYRSCPIPLGEGARVLRLDWTLRLPRLHPPPIAPVAPDPNTIFFGTGADMSTGDTADATMTLMDAAGNPLLPARLSVPGADLSLLLADGLLRLGVNLRPRLGDNDSPWDSLNAPLIESPVLDDLTVTYVPSGGIRVSGWREGE